MPQSDRSSGSHLISDQLAGQVHARSLLQCYINQKLVYHRDTNEFFPPRQACRRAQSDSNARARLADPRERLLSIRRPHRADSVR